jgi:hypothetical protein
MMQQRDRLFRALGHIVAKVDDLDVLVPFLQQLGRDHRKFGALAAHYPAVGASLLATLEQYPATTGRPELAADWPRRTASSPTRWGPAAAGEGRTTEAQPWWDAEVVSHERAALDLGQCCACGPTLPLHYESGSSR